MPDKIFPEIILEFSCLIFKKEEILEPILVLKYLGLSTDDPEIAIILSALYFPFNIAFPIITKSGKFKVQTTSPLLIGDVLLIIVLKLPEG